MKAILIPLFILIFLYQCGGNGNETADTYEDTYLDTSSYDTAPDTSIDVGEDSTPECTTGIWVYGCPSYMDWCHDTWGCPLLPPRPGPVTAIWSEPIANQALIAAGSNWYFLDHSTYPSTWKDEERPAPGPIVAFYMDWGRVVVGDTFYEWDSSSETWIPDDRWTTAPGTVTAMGMDSRIAIDDTIYRWDSTSDLWIAMLGPAPETIVGLTHDTRPQAAWGRHFHEYDDSLGWIVSDDIPEAPGVISHVHSGGSGLITIVLE